MRNDWPFRTSRCPWPRKTSPPSFRRALTDCAKGDASAQSALLECACERLTRLARKMLKGFPRVRRWEETDDVLQNALVRLRRALETTSPESVRSFVNLAAVQIRRELIDLARHYDGPTGMAAHHESQDAVGWLARIAGGAGCRRRHERSRTPRGVEPGSTVASNP